MSVLPCMGWLTIDCSSIVSQPIYTGQYRHYSSFNRWSRKVAWNCALVHRATKTCSTQQLLQLEILNIKRFASWNGFPRWICDKLITNPPFLLSGSDCHSLGRKAISFYETATERFPAYSNSQWNSRTTGKPQNATVSLLKKTLRRNPTKAQSCINLSAQGVMHPTSGKRTGACTLGLMNTRSQINLKTIIMCMIASILSMFFPY